MVYSSDTLRAFVRGALKLCALSLVASAAAMVVAMSHVQAQTGPAWTEGKYRARSGDQLPPCGEPEIKINDGLPVYPPGQFPIKLPAVSPHGVRNDLPNPFHPVTLWKADLGGGRTWESSASITTGPDGTLWVLDRKDPAKVDPIIQLEPSGKVLKTFGAGLFVNPHKMTHEMDKEGFWVADMGGHQVFKISYDGKVLMVLGKKGVPGSGPGELSQPTQVAVAPNGDIFVGNGHSHGSPVDPNRIAKFDKAGKFIKSWGRKGVGNGEFDVIHDLTFDSRGRLFVADRNNSRIQIFDQDGKHLDTWFQFGRPAGIYIDKRDDTIYVGDNESRDGYTNTGQYFFYPHGYGYNPGVQRGIRIGSAVDGSVRYFIADPCPYPYPGGGSFTEGVTADLDGNVYSADALAAMWKMSKK